MGGEVGTGPVGGALTYVLAIIRSGMAGYGEGPAGVPLTFRREAGSCGIYHTGIDLSV